MVRRTDAPTRPRVTRLPAMRAAAALASAAAALGGVWIAAHHPLLPGAALAGFGLWLVLAGRRPGWWIGVLPAALPVASFAPWTGWLAFDEFDLLALGAIAAAQWQLARRAGGRSTTATPATTPATTTTTAAWRLDPLAALALLLGGLTLAGLARGLVDAAPSTLGWFQGHADPLNSWRVAKSTLYALLLLPSLANELRAAPERAVRALSGGMLAGLAVVAAVVTWERVAYPGWLDFSVRYRTVALFWEMHVGGAAIDVYLALATPFVGWALWRARAPVPWAAAALLALAAAYAALTTFSRGVYLAVAGPLLLLGLWLSGQRFGFDPRPWLLRFAAASAAGALLALALAWLFDRFGATGIAAALLAQCALMATLRRRFAGVSRQRWRVGAAVTLATALVVEGVVVLGAHSFMLMRMAATEHDFGSRVAHWRHGLALVDGPLDQAFGIGLGRLPAHYAASGPGGEWPGAVRWSDGGAGPAVRLDGPPTQPALAGLYSLTQRVALHPEGAYRVGLDLRTPGGTDLDVSVCEMHLLYERHCQAARLRIAPAADWRHVEVALHGPLLDAGAPWAPRFGVFSLAVARAAASVELRDVSVRGADGVEQLRNGDFAAGLAHWFPAAQFYFLPWHIDNLGLELLIERGAAGAAAFAWLFGWALWAPLAAAAAKPVAGAAFAPFLAAALCGGLTVGLVSSVMDVPRVAFLCQLLAWFAILLARGDGRSNLPPAAADAENAPFMMLR